MILVKNPSEHILSSIFRDFAPCMSVTESWRRMAAVLYQGYPDARMPLEMSDILSQGDRKRCVRWLEESDVEEPG